MGCPYKGLSPAAKALADKLWDTWGEDRSTSDWPDIHHLEEAAHDCLVAASDLALARGRE